jgi:hypothetical protein
MRVEGYIAKCLVRELEQEAALADRGVADDENLWNQKAGGL